MEALFNFLRQYMDPTESELRAIRDSNSIQSYKKNEIISNLEMSYFVLSGGLCAYYNSSERQVVTDFFLTGEPVILTNQSGINQDIYFLRCLEDTTVAVSSPQEGELIIQQFPRFETVCRRFAEEKFNYLLKFTNHLKLLSPIEKYEFIFRERPELIQSVPQHLLASYLGLAPETLSRVRRQFAVPLS